MLWVLSVLLVFLWVIGMTSGLTVGPWIHLLLVAAIGTMIVALAHRQLGGRTQLHSGGRP